MLFAWASSKGSSHLPKAVRRFSTTISRSKTQEGHRLILGIETSRDVTCAALISCPEAYSASSLGSTTPVEPRKVIASEIVRQDHSFSSDIHPFRAQKWHDDALPKSINQCLERAGISPVDGKEVDAVAVTLGPGIPGCLGVGMQAAKRLAAQWNKPLIPVHHMEAHALTPFLFESHAGTPLRFPFLTFLLSAGHTMLVLVRGMGDYKILTSVSDQTIGETLDKLSRLFAITPDWTKESPGAALAAFASEAPVKCPPDLVPHFRPLAPPLKRYPEMEFLGYGPALRRQQMRALRAYPRYKTYTHIPIQWQQYHAAQLLEAIFEQIQDKVRLLVRGSADLKVKDRRQRTKAGEQVPIPPRAERIRGKAFPAAWESAGQEIASCQHLVLSGGVASNPKLRAMVQYVWRQVAGNRVVCPPVKHCVDNAVMVANVGALMYDQYVDADGSRKEDMYKAAVDSMPRKQWSLEDLANNSSPTT